MGQVALGRSLGISLVSAMAVFLSLVVPHAAQAQVADAKFRTTVKKTNTKQTKTKKTRVILSGGANLRVKVTPRLPKNRQYKFTLSRLEGSTWTKVRSLKTQGKKTRQRIVSVGCGQYRVNVHKRAGYRASVSNQRGVGQATGKYSSDGPFVTYTPACWSSAKRKQAIVTFSPSGQDKAPGAYGELLRDSADKHGFMVLGWKQFKNSTNGYGLEFVYEAANGAIYQTGSIFTKARSDINAVFDANKIDKSRVMFMGFSGGGSFAHALSILYPGIAQGLLINTAMVWGAVSAHPYGYNGPEFWEYMRDFQTVGDYNSSRKQAIFLESPTDFRYPEMQQNASLYRLRGWTVRQARFAGGHQVAPKSLYDFEITRLVNSPDWKN